MKRWLGWVLGFGGGLILLASLLWGATAYLAAQFSPREVTFGVSFSKYKALSLGLDWQQTYLSILDELKVKELRLMAYWDDVEREPGEFTFDDIDWQLREAKRRDVRIMLAVGYKLPGWPECHVPVWAKPYGLDEQYRYFLDALPTIINHLKQFDNIWAWQAENEPFFRFGDCPTWWIRKDFLDDEIRIIRSLDERPIAITESGEGDLWLKAANRGDLVGASMYRNIWNKYFRYSYAFTPNFYRAKAGLVKLVRGKEVFLHEVQMEPWTPRVSLRDFPLEDQYKTMSHDQFLFNIDFVRKIGFSPAYLWGTEWWYWATREGNDAFYWEEAQKLWP